MDPSVLSALPTDSLYKFMALAGLLILLFSLVGPPYFRMKQHFRGLEIKQTKAPLQAEELLRSGISEVLNKRMDAEGPGGALRRSPECGGVGKTGASMRSLLTLVVFTSGALACSKRAESPTPPAQSDTPKASQPNATTVSSAPSGTNAENTFKLTSVGESRICAGESHSCYLEPTGRLWCWGGNSFGEIGNGTHGWQGRSEDTDTEAETVPTPFSGYSLPPLRSVACVAGTCAISKTGELWCWGHAAGTTAREPFSDKPVKMALPLPVLKVKPGGDHSCAILDDQSLWCWGENDEGQLGVAGVAQARNSFSEPRAVDIVQGSVLDVAVAGSSTCVVKTDGSVWCWGYNDSGQIGTDEELRGGPVRVSLESVGSITSAGRHYCALTSAGEVFCWGAAGVGQLGDPPPFPLSRSTPRRIELSAKALQSAATSSASAALTENGTVWTWGDNLRGWLGVEGLKHSVAPVMVPLSEIVQVSGSGSHICALRADETMWCWGAGRQFQLGTGREEDSATPVQVRLPRD